MLVLKWLGAGLVWIVAGVVGLLGVVLSVTIILLPLGIPLLILAKKLSSLAAVMVVPKAVRDPVGVLGKKGADLGDQIKAKAPTPKKRRFGFKRKSRTEKLLDWVIG